MRFYSLTFNTTALKNLVFIHEKLLSSEQENCYEIEGAFTQSVEFSWIEL